MPEERERLRRLSARLARGRAIDWSAEERAAATEVERAAIRELRVVAALAAFHESIQSEDAPAEMAVSVSLGRSLAAGFDGDASSDGNESTTVETLTIDPPRLPRLAAGSRWGHLEILESIGRGAFGEVYRARDTRLDRIVALKLLDAAAPTAGDEAVREARLLARVRHPNVVTVHGADRIDGRVGIWMEYVRGDTLARLLRRRGSFDAREAALIGIDLCRALSAVHAAGIAHRDVKPANVMRAEGGRIVLMDFGLGYEAPRDRIMGDRNLSGTPLFMAPEVLGGTPADERADIYALGVVLFALVTNALPVTATSLIELEARHARGERRHARDLRPDLPEAFDRVLDRALQPAPDARFRSAGEMERALLATLGVAVPAAPAAGPARRTTWTWGLAGVLIIGAVVAGALWLRGAGPIAGPGAAPAAAGVPLAGQPDLTLVGEAANDLYGLAVAGVGDVDLDGFDDVIISAPFSDAGGKNAGRVYLYRGGRNGLEARPSWTLTGADTSALLGHAFAPFTMLSLDGFGDLVIGAPNGKHGYGQVQVFPGSRTGPASTPIQTLTATKSGTLFGFAVSTGDVNHDGREDLLVGEPSWPPENTGRACLYFSVADSFAGNPAWTRVGTRGSFFGIDVSIGGDFNKDGYADAAIGASTTGIGTPESLHGQAFVFLGSATGLDTIPMILHGRQPGQLFGRAIFAAGDVDHDGYEDLCIGSEGGANGESLEGIAEVYFGSPQGLSPFGAVFFESNVMGANFGGHGGPVGDLDGDGCDDIMLGALRYQRTEPRAGAAFVYRGSRDRRLATSWFRVGSAGGAWYGAACGSAGDVNGDGFLDVLVAAPSWDGEAGTEVGLVEVFLNTRRE